MVLWVVTMLAPNASASEKDAETCLRTKVWDGYAEGWGVRTMTSGALPDGGTRNYLVTLYAGNEYRVRTCADDAVTNLDVILYDVSGTIITRDDSANREPEITFKPTTTGTYYVVLYNRQAASAGAEGHVAMAVVYR